MPFDLAKGKTLHSQCPDIKSAYTSAETMDTIRNVGIIPCGMFIWGGIGQRVGWRWKVGVEAESCLCLFCFFRWCPHGLLDDT